MEAVAEITAQVKNVPALRFPEFEGEWKEVRLGEICDTFKSGESITSKDIADSGEHPVYGGNGLRGYTNKYTHDGFYTLIGRQGALCGNINRVYGKSYISEHAIAVSANDSSDTEWLAQKLDYMNLNRLSESSAQPGLAVNKLLRLKLRVPSLSEQQKIASFLSTVDDKIQQLSKKKELLEKYKKGVMQQIFSQQIRLKDAGGNDFPEWEEKRLGEVTKLFSKRNKNLIDAKVYSVTNTNGFVLQSEHFDKEVAGEDLTGYKIIRRNEFAYNPARINVGSIALFKDDVGVISSLYVCFSTTEELDDDFLVYILQLDSTKYKINTYGEGGVRIYLWYPLFASIKVDLPSLAEQRKIVTFLSSIDNKINQTSKQLEQAQQFKKGLLQQMFV